MEITMKKFFLIIAVLIGVPLVSNAGTCAISSCSTTTCTTTVEFVGYQPATLTLMYPNCVCVGDVFTILGTFTFSTTFLTDVGSISFEDIAPNPGAAGSTAPGLTTLSPTSPTALSPNLTGAYYVAADGVEHCANTSGQGVVFIPSGLMVPAATFSYSFQVEATAAGFQTWYPSLTQSGEISCERIFEINILVTPRATTPNGTEPLTCQNSVLEATLPTPGGTIGLYTYVVDSADATGGTVALTNPSATGGSPGAGQFIFTPTSGFFGTASFQYNVNPIGSVLPNFCPASPSGVISIPVAQNPTASNETITGCAGGGVTGNLNTLVTGGVPPYVFAVGAPSCGSVALTDLVGDFIFTGPTGGQSSCNFVYFATDTNGCLGTGIVSVNINALPTAVAQTVSTCVNMPVTGTVTGSGGSGTYTLFTVVTFPSHFSSFSFFPATGAFTYSPSTGFTGVDSFTFTVTDSNGCTSTPGTVTIDVDPFPTTSSTAVNACENTLFNGTLVPLVTGGTGPFVFTLSGPQPSCGTVVITSTGPYVFVPNVGTIGSCSFQYAVTQGGCPGSGPNVVTVTILPAPITEAASTGVCAGGTVTDNLNNYVISASGALTFTGGPGVNGTLNLNPNGAFTFMPSIPSGIASFMWQVFSSLLTCPSSPQTYTITVNAAPTVVTGMIAACGTNPTIGSLVPNVPGGFPPLTFTGNGAPVNGTVSINSNGQFTFTPFGPPGNTGSFPFAVTDGHGCTGSGTEIIVVNPTPTATSGAANVCSGASSTGSLTSLVSGGTPPYIYAGGAAIGGIVIVNPITGSYVFISNGAPSGSFVFTVTDQNGCTASGTVFITVNPGPSASSGLFTGCEGALIMGSLVGLVSGNSPFTFSGPFGQMNGVAVVNSDGSFTFLPSIPIGQGSFNYEVTDSSVPPCTSKPTPVTIDIEQGPEALPANFTGCENTVFSSGLNMFVTGGEPPYTFSQVGPSPACGAVVVNPNGTFTFTPTVGFTGPCTFIWQVADSIPCTSTAPATVFVSQNPIASNSGLSGACTSDSFSGNLNAFTTGGIPPYMFTGGNAINGVLSLLASGPFSFTPTVVGAASFQYSATDSVGCMSNTGTISFDASQSPVLTGANPLDVCQKSTVTSTVTATLGLLPYVSAEILATTNGSAVVNSFVGGVVTFTFTPSPTLVFTTPTVIGSVTIGVTDSNGCVGQITITVNIHQNPIAASTGVITCTSSLAGTLVPLVTGGIPPYIFGPTGSLTPAGCGTVTITPGGNYTFTAPAGFSGLCTFDYQVTESSASMCTSTGAVTVDVDIPPVVSNFTGCACANVPVTFSLASLVTDGVPPYTFAIVGAPCVNLGPQITQCTITGGTVILNTQTGLFTFIPNLEFTGIASFMFQVTDSLGCVSNIGTVFITLPCCPPTALPTSMVE